MNQIWSPISKCHRCRMDAKCIEHKLIRTNSFIIIKTVIVVINFHFFLVLFSELCS